MAANSSAGLSPKLGRYFKDYGSYHRTHGNELCHYIGIPMILVALLGLLGRLAFGPAISDELRLDGGTVLWAIATFFYLKLDWRIGAPFSLVTAGAYFLGRALPVPVDWVLFVVGWVFQLVGHSKYEKNRPAFFKNGEHLLIGPIWIFARLLKWS
jgi:uncharacterized membrane protein YGL010W